MLKTILVATDASPASNRAISLAAELAGKFDALLHILHVMRDVELPPELKKMAEVEHILGTSNEVFAFVGEKILEEAKERATAAGATHVQTSLGEGDPAATVVHYAEEFDADLIVIGTRGLGEIKSVLMGSVSRKITNLAQKNVLIVK